MRVSSRPASLPLCLQAALQDWQSDTEVMLKLWKTRALHFEGFRDSVFELIDFYSPTLNPKQYVGYLKVLIKEVTEMKDGTRYWKHRWPAIMNEQATAYTTLLCNSLRHGDDHLDASFEARDLRLKDTYAKWLEEADEGAQESLSFRGFRSACDSVLLHEAGWSERSQDIVFMSMLMRRVDIDGDGCISLTDLLGFVLRDAAPTMITLYSPKRNGRAMSDLATNTLQARKVIQTLRRKHTASRSRAGARS